MRYLKDYQGDGAIDRLLQALGLSKGREEDYQRAEGLVDAIPDMTICETLRAIGIEATDPETSQPIPGYREAWLAIQAAAFRKNQGAD